MSVPFVCLLSDKDLNSWSLLSFWVSVLITVPSTIVTIHRLLRRLSSFLNLIFWVFLCFSVSLPVVLSLSYFRSYCPCMSELSGITVEVPRTEIWISLRFCVCSFRVFCFQSSLYCILCFVFLFCSWYCQFSGFVHAFWAGSNLPSFCFNFILSIFKLSGFVPCEDSLLFRVILVF